MIYAYINQNSVVLSFSEQKSAIEGWCESESRKLDSFLVDEGELFSKPKNGDFVVVCDFAKLGQDKGKILSLIQYYLSNGISIISANRGITLKPAKISAETFSLIVDSINEIDFSIASERTKAGLVKAQEKGVRVGRKLGQHPEKLKLTGYEEEIRTGIKNGESILSLSKKFNVSWITMKDFVKKHI